MKQTKLIITVICSMLSIGCAINGEKQNLSMTPYEKAIFEERKRTNEVLSKAAFLSSKALAVYTRTKQALQQKELTAEQVRLARWQNQYIPTNMGQLIKMPWDSAPEPVLKTISSIAGYELKFVNQRPPISRSVTIDSQNRNIRDYIFIIYQQTKDVGYIERIDIDDRSERKVITVYYAKF